MKRQPSVDPMERLICYALNCRGLKYVTETHPDAKGLDFFLPDQNIHIEVKQFHSPRISEQMSRADNVIAAQGRMAVKALADLIAGNEL